MRIFTRTEIDNAYIYGAKIIMDRYNYLKILKYIDVRESGWEKCPEMATQLVLRLPSPTPMFLLSLFLLLFTPPPPFPSRRDSATLGRQECKCL